MRKDLSQFFIDQMTNRGVRLGRQDGSDWIKVYCIKGHDRKTPSLGVNKSTGSFNCFGCGVHGSWNTLAALIGAEPLTEDNAPDPFMLLRIRLNSALEEAEKKELERDRLPWDIKPWNKPWRDVCAYTMNAATAFKWFDDASRCYRILLPVWLYDEEPVGWVARRLDKIKSTPYRNSTNLKGIIKYLLYPYHIVEQMRTKTIVLVEGPYDALRLIDDDIPALSLLGVRNYDRSCHVHLRNLGVRKVVMGLDNDKAGVEGRKEIAPQLQQDFAVTRWRYKSKDPGDSTMTERRNLRKLL